MRLVQARIRHFLDGPFPQRELVSLAAELIDLLNLDRLLYYRYFLLLLRMKLSQTAADSLAEPAL